MFIFISRLPIEHGLEREGAAFKSRLACHSLDLPICCIYNAQGAVSPRTAAIFPPARRRRKVVAAGDICSYGCTIPSRSQTPLPDSCCTQAPVKKGPSFVFISGSTIKKTSECEGSFVARLTRGARYMPAAWIFVATGRSAPN